MEWKFVEFGISRENEIVDTDKWFSVCYNSEMNSYLLAAVVPWIAHYRRFYAIDESDYNLYKTDKEAFYLKFSKEISQIGPDCFAERFIGAEALRDYDGENRFQDKFPAEGNPFKGFLYYDSVLYARIVWKHKEIYVPPVRVVKAQDGSEDYPLRDSCKLVRTLTGHPVYYRLNIEL